MSLSSLLDSVPQVPQDYANHALYGGLLGLVVSVLCIRVGFPCPWGAGVAVVFALTAVKKWTDYGREPLSMCIGKTLWTPVIGYVIFAITTFYK